MAGTGVIGPGGQSKDRGDQLRGRIVRELQDRAPSEGDDELSAGSHYRRHGGKRVFGRSHLSFAQDSVAITTLARGRAAIISDCSGGTGLGASKKFHRLASSPRRLQSKCDRGEWRRNSDQ